MIAVDTNILVYAHREDAEHHAAASSALERLATGREQFAVPWPCAHEFLAIVTHPRVYVPSSTPDVALSALRALIALPHLVMIGEATDHFVRFEELILSANVRGPKVHDGRIAAICLAHGVRELWTADRDFSYFPALRTHNPLLGQ